MYYEQYGNLQNDIIVFLHGAYFVHAFGRQYSLADRYCLIVPHIMGYGNEASNDFDTESAVAELADFIKSLGKRVTLVGFSLGAQLAVVLASRHSELIDGAIFVSPWLIKSEASLAKSYRESEKQLTAMRGRLRCGVIAAMNGLPKAQRAEFVTQMQSVSDLTLKNTVYNGITTDILGDFARLAVPTVAIAGEREWSEVKESVLWLGKTNPNCTAELWQRAAHNIPPVFHKRFNERICEFMTSKNPVDTINVNDDCRIEIVCTDNVYKYNIIKAEFDDYSGKYVWTPAVGFSPSGKYDTRDKAINAAMEALSADRKIFTDM